MEPEKRTKIIAGKPSKKCPETLSKLKILWRLGACDVEIAEILDIGVSTLSEWVTDPEYQEAKKISKNFSDTAVEVAMYQRACGFTRTIERLNKFGEPVECKEQVLPDPVSGIFWLTNRQRDKWKHRNAMELTGKDDQPLLPVLNVTLKSK